MSFYKNGHELVQTAPHTEELVCLKCGLRTSYASYRRQGPLPECEK
jgi:hypothetical protein